MAINGTKIHVNASRHSALLYEHAGMIKAQLQAESADMMAKVMAADHAGVPVGTLIIFIIS